MTPGQGSLTLRAVPQSLRPAFVDLLGDELLLRLETVSPGVRQAVEHLVSNNAVARVLGLDAAFDHVLRQDRLQDGAPEVLPFLFALALSPRYRHASSILTRLGAVLATLDDPPGSLARATAEDRERTPLRARVWEAYRERLPRLLNVARSSRDPESCRAAALTAAHFPEAADQLVPILYALLSGARDEEARASLRAALERARADQNR